jgi:hypothetical protein
MSSKAQRIQRTRRSFLRAVGVGAAALPFYRLLENEVVRAQEGMLPQKFVGVGTFHCTTQQFYARRAGETDTSYDIAYDDCALRPFDDAATYGSSFKNDLTIFEGFDYGVGDIGPDGRPLHVNMHGALALFLTGSSASGGGEMNFAMQNESLDQYLAGRLGGETRFRSVQLTNETDYGDLSSSSCISCGPGGALMGRMTSPEEIWDTYFASLIAPDDTAARRRRLIGASVLDFVAGDLTRLSGRLGSTERAKLDQHLTAVRDMERRLTSTASATCSVPTRRAERGNVDPADDYVIANAYNDGSKDFDRVVDFQLELLAQMLICDLTRFGTLVIAGTAGEGRSPGMVPRLDGAGGNELGATGTDLPLPNDFHNSIAHLSGDPRLEVQRAVASMHRYYNGKVARLMQHLRAADALDSTLILVGNEGGDGAGHSIGNVPILLAGGAQGALTLGRRVVAPGRTARVGEAPSGGATSHNPILVAVANAFGAEIDSFGTCADASMTAGVDGLL